jgi:hypothetical protein
MNKRDTRPIYSVSTVDSPDGVGLTLSFWSREEAERYRDWADREAWHITPVWPTPEGWSPNLCDHATTFNALPIGARFVLDPQHYEDFKILLRTKRGYRHVIGGPQFRLPARQIVYRLPNPAAQETNQCQ